MPKNFKGARLSVTPEISPRANKILAKHSATNSLTLNFLAVDTASRKGKK